MIESWIVNQLKTGVKLLTDDQLKEAFSQKDNVDEWQAILVKEVKRRNRFVPEIVDFS